MEKQISTNICKIAEFEDSIYYDAICSCGSDQHRQTLTVEVDSFIVDGEIHNPEVSLQLDSKIATNEFVSFDARYDFEEAAKVGNYFGMAFHRVRILISSFAIKLKFTKDLWLNGYITAGNVFTFKNEAAIDDYIAAIIQAKEKLKKENQSES